MLVERRAVGASGEKTQVPRNLEVVLYSAGTMDKLTERTTPTIPSTEFKPTKETTANGNGHNGNGHKEANGHHVNGHDIDKSLNGKRMMAPETKFPKESSGTMPFSEAFNGQNLTDYVDIFKKDFGADALEIRHHDFKGVQIDFKPGQLVRQTYESTDASATYGTLLQVNLINPDIPQGSLVLIDSSNQPVARYVLDNAKFRETEGEDGRLNGIEFAIPANLEQRQPSTVVTIEKKSIARLKDGLPTGKTNSSTITRVKSA